MADTKASSLPADALKDAGGRLMNLLVERAAETASNRIGSLTDRLDDVSENGAGLRSVLGGSRKDSDEQDDAGDSGDGGSGGGLLSGLKDKVSGLFGGGGGSGSGGGKKLKVTNIVEELDVGLPLRTTYDLWTQFGDFPSFMKKVESVEQESDEKTHWKAQVFLSHREWDATTIEQVPDSHIVWRSQGAKGHVDGAVSFTELGPNLTRVLLVLEYWPQGLFERTGNIWRAQGRRARLEFKNFRRHAMATALLHPDEVEGWRGEIRESEVVTTHEEALEQEGRDEDEREGRRGSDDGYDEADEYAEGADEEADEEAEDADGAEDEYDDYDSEEAEEADDEGAADESEDYDDYNDYDEADEPDEGPEDEAEEAEPEDEPDEEPPPARRRSARRQPAGAGGRSR